MAFPEVRVYEVREVLRLWLGNHGLRTLEQLSGWTARPSAAM
jgi:hypothetical protein